MNWRRFKWTRSRFVLLVVAGFSPRSLAVRENSTNAAKARDYILRHAQLMHMFYDLSVPC